MNEHDQVLQNELVLRLSTLEHQRTQLEAALNTAAGLHALDLTRAIVDEVVKVAQRIDTSANSAPLTNAFAEAGNLYSTLDQMSKDFDPSLWQWVLSLFNTPRTSATQQRQEFCQMMTDTYRVVETFLGLAGTQFQSEAAEREWAQAAGLFLHDLRRVVEQVNS
jgi:hypothetical protein